MKTIGMSTAGKYWFSVVSRCTVGGLLAAALSSGCATQVKVARVNQSPSSTKGATMLLAPFWWQEDSLNLEVVTRYRLCGLLRRDPERALTELKGIVERCGAREDIAAFADLTFRYGHSLRRSEPQKSLGLCLTAAGVGYQFLVERSSPLAANRWELHVRNTYNQATAGVVALLQQRPGGIRGSPVVSACGQSFKLEAVSGDSTLDLLDYNQWLPADDWSQTGLRVHYRNEGLGARLIAFRTNRVDSPLELHRPDEGIFDHATAILVFSQVSPGAAGTQSVSLVFYNPVLTPEVSISGEKWRLAADFTEPWAMLLSHTRPLFKTRWSALMQPSRTSRPRRLYLMAPYSPDRIPVVMVHGLRSTPLAWQQLTNELVGDPEIRDRYQLWHYLYPTGFPVFTSAANFRDELERLRRIVDPHGHDPATQNMVVIGHSMGGLLARTLVTDSGDAVWNSTFAIPLQDTVASTDQRAELRRLFYFQPKPYVKRVIFVAVPHRGSKRADGFLARFASGRVQLPAELHEFVSSLLAAMPNLLKPEAAGTFARGYPTSIRALSPRMGTLRAMADLPVAPAIPFHSIVGDRGRRDGEKSSDGVVAYKSSHLPGAVSELIVPSDHRTYDNPQAMAEVKRILKLHLAQLGPDGQTAQHKDQ